MSDDGRYECSRDRALDEVVAHLQTLLVLPAMKQLYAEQELSLYKGLDSTNMESAIELVLRLKGVRLGDKMYKD
tara:strand:- start:482 stop:703 length:222 start_codon:yes stop_codon:yes gene_type:complete